MGLEIKSVEKLENFPKFEKFHDYSWDRDRYWGDNFPYRRFNRWLESQKNTDIDSVIHKFVHLDWVLAKYRTMEQLRRYVEFDTFTENGKVMYYADYSILSGERTSARAINESSSKTFYVDPQSRKLKVFVPPTRKSWQKAAQERFDGQCKILGDYHQLVKLNGIWYEIKAEVLPGEYPWWTTLQRKGPRDLLTDKKSYLQYSSHPSDKLPFVKIVLKRQLSGKALKQHGIQND